MAQRPRSPSVAAEIPRARRAPVRLLHAGGTGRRQGPAGAQSGPDGNRDALLARRQPLPLHRLRQDRPRRSRRRRRDARKLISQGMRRRRRASLAGKVSRGFSYGAPSGPCRTVRTDIHVSRPLSHRSRDTRRSISSGTLHASHSGAGKAAIRARKYCALGWATMDMTFSCIRKLASAPGVPEDARGAGNQRAVSSGVARRQPLESPRTS